MNSPLCYSPVAGKPSSSSLHALNFSVSYLDKLHLSSTHAHVDVLPLTSLDSPMDSSKWTCPRSISPSLSTAFDSRSPSPTFTSPSPSPPPSTLPTCNSQTPTNFPFPTESGKFRLVPCSLETADALIYLPSPGSLPATVANNVSDNGAILLVGSALEKVRHPSRSITKSARVRPYKIMHGSITAQKPSATAVLTRLFK